MKELKEGELISEFKPGNTFIVEVIFPFFIIVFSLVTVESLGKDYPYLIENSKSFFFGSLLSLFLISLYRRFYLNPNVKNPSVIYFKDYLLVKSDEEKGEIEVPFKMIKRFRLSDMNSTVLVEYEQNYIFRTELGGKEWYIVSNPKFSNNLTIPGPDSIDYPQDKKDKKYPLGEFSFRLKRFSKQKKISIVDELNKQIV